VVYWVHGAKADNPGSDEPAENQQAGPLPVKGGTMKHVKWLAVAAVLLFSAVAAANSFTGSGTWCTVENKMLDNPSGGKFYRCHWDSYDACAQAGSGQSLPGNQPWTCVKHPNK
jgi:hypothetical protein